MATTIARRTILIQSMLLFPAGLASALAQSARGAGSRDVRAGRDRLREVEQKSGGRLGVAVLDADRGVTLVHRPDERFPMCSTFKFLAVATVLARVDRKDDSLDRRISFSKDDLLEYAPITTARVQEG